MKRKLKYKKVYNVRDMCESSKYVYCPIYIRRMKFQQEMKVAALRVPAKA